MQKSNSRQTGYEKDCHSHLPLQLLLFVDERPSAQERIQQIQNYLENLKADYPFEIQVIEVKERPDLVEYFRLVATPALVKIYPKPKQILAGSDLVAQLKKCWFQWQASFQEQEANSTQKDNALAVIDGSSEISSQVSYSAEVIQLSDEIFRLKQEKEELLRQLNFKDQILAMLAHDLRSPLTAASIAVETLELAENQSSCSERAATFKKQLYKQAKTQFRSMNRMITDILEAAKENSAQFRLQAHKLYLQFLCRDIIVLFEEQFRAKNLQVEQDLPQDLPAVYVDEELIRQVLVNLLENAIKYTPEKGKIRISLLHRTSQKIQVSVCDNGLGIPEEKRNRIFEGHFRLKRDQAKEGYGLGLALCRKVIQAHYGHIWVDSNPNQGSCFHFTLPVYHS